MALKWNCIDDVLGAANAIAARIIVATVTNAEDLGGGSGRITIELRDMRRQLYSPTTKDECVLDLMLADTAAGGESEKARFGGIVGAGGIISEGGGSAHIQVIAQESKIQIACTTTATRPKDTYIIPSQGHGSTYLVRAGQRWGRLTFGVY